LTSAPTHARGWRDGASACGFAPVPALEQVEGDEAVPLTELTEAHGAVDLEHPLVLQLRAAGKHAAHAQHREHEVCHVHSAALFAGRILHELSLTARTGGEHGS
jgi:hypothetical protein